MNIAFDPEIPILQIYSPKIKTMFKMAIKHMTTLGSYLNIHRWRNARISEHIHTMGNYTTSLRNE